jgi:hypothetical protein
MFKSSNQRENQMEISQNLCSNAIRKGALLITKADDLGMRLDGYGELGENSSNGNVYLWLEDYNFTLYIDLGSDDIKALWSSPIDDREEIISLEDMSYLDIEEWSFDLDNQVEA